MTRPVADQGASREEPKFNRMINAEFSRRGFLRAAGAAGAAAFLVMPPLQQSASAKGTRQTLLGFKSVPASRADLVQVPPGYQAEVLIAWGDPIFSGGPAFQPNADAAAQEVQFGDNNDGMAIFPLAADRAVLAVNNEYPNYEYLFPHQGKALTAADVRKAQAAMGVSIVEMERVGNRWRIDRRGSRNRRITVHTPMAISGPAAGHKLLQTAADPAGRLALGTLGNCAEGRTPWGPYLTCEENFHEFFGSEAELSLGESADRYAANGKYAPFQWHKFDERFDLDRNPNEANRFGWVVEIDPLNPASVPKKRTALGRFKHENAALIVNRDGRVVVYMGDDERGEHIYKFVSRGTYDPQNAAANRDLLDEGTLYVAVFEGNEGELKGTGRWMELTLGKNGLTPENGFADQAEVLIFARLAATQAGATTMDRPEWVAVHPNKQHVYCTLTNNKDRGLKPNQPVNAANPRVQNRYGHIVRWRPAGGDHAVEEFDWDLYLLAGNPEIHPHGLRGGSESITAANMFNSPDGIAFDGAGRLWILTDGDYSNEGESAGMGNNQMLCSDPETGEVRRFLTGPVACEITGIAFSPDHRTMFLGVQHPGEESAASHFPDGGDSIPRSSVVMITRDDGGVIGE